MRNVTFYRMSEEGPLRKLLRGEGPILSTLRGKERIYRERALVQGVPPLDDMKKLFFDVWWSRKQIGYLKDSTLWAEIPKDIRNKYEATEDHLGEAGKQLWDIGVASYGFEAWDRAINPGRYRHRE